MLKTLLRITDQSGDYKNLVYSKVIANYSNAVIYTYINHFSCLQNGWLIQKQR